MYCGTETHNENDGGYLEIVIRVEVELELVVDIARRLFDSPFVQVLLVPSFAVFGHLLLMTRPQPWTS